MFRESKQTTAKIIELIQQLPEKEQKIIIKKLSASPKAKPKKQEKSVDSDYLDRIAAFQKYVSAHRFKLPVGYKFNREEANAR
jgi:hypothetical protein